MRSLSDPDIVRIWDIGQHQHPLDRALTCLAFAFPERSLSTLAQLTLGQRDALLLMLRERTFGPTMESVATCPHCHEQLEFALQARDICVMDLTAEPMTSLMVADQGNTALASTVQPEIHQCQLGDFLVHFRLPTSLDVAAVMTMGQPDIAQQALAQRCLVKVELDQTEFGAEEKAKAIASLTQQLGPHLAQADPQAEILLDLQCPACGHPWQMMFDIVAYLWAELSNRAKRLLIDVHQLARTYGWSEQDILAMSSTRRQYYLELIG